MKNTIEQIITEAQIAFRQLSHTPDAAELCKHHDEQLAKALRARVAELEKENEAVCQANKVYENDEPRLRATITALAWRQLSTLNREHFKTVAAELPKGRVVIESTATNSEAANFASQIADMLRASGYDVVENFGSWSNQGKPLTGVWIFVKDKKSAPAYAIGLEKALGEIDITASTANLQRYSDAILLLVGNKP